MAKTHAKSEQHVVYPMDVVKAYHETGHAMAAIDANMRLIHISMTIDLEVEPGAAGISGGGALLEISPPDASKELTLFDRNTLAKKILVLLAGSATETFIKAGKPKRFEKMSRPIAEDIVNTLLGMYADIEWVVDRLRVLHPDNARGRRGVIVRVAYVYISWWIWQNWNVVDAIAQRLLREGKLAGDDVAAMMGEMNCGSLYKDGHLIQGKFEGLPSWREVLVP